MSFVLFLQSTTKKQSRTTKLLLKPTLFERQLFISIFRSLNHFIHLFFFSRAGISGVILRIEAAPPNLDGVAGEVACIGRGRRCDLNSGPVCGIDASGVTRTFENKCMADLAYCRFGTCKYFGVLTSFSYFCIVNQTLVTYFLFNFALRSN